MNSAEVDEVKRHFNVVAERLEGRIQLLAEGLGSLDERVVRLDEKVDRLERRMDEQFDETRAMIKLSHAELDRRLRTLEGRQDDLESRIQRLETR
jgi:chromosome segregation ATPase